MIDLFIKIDSSKTLEMLSERGRRRVFKEAYREGLSYWHKYILPFHFMAGNSLLYPGAFIEKKNGVPLVDTGEFRDRVLEEKIIRSTYKGATSRYLYGRPSNQNNSKFYAEFNKDIKSMSEKNKRIIFSTMRGKKIKFEEAKKQFINKRFRSSVYSASMKIRMKRGINVFNITDLERIKSVMQKFIVINISSLGKANLRNKF